MISFGVCFLTFVVFIDHFRFIVSWILNVILQQAKKWGHCRLYYSPGCLYRTNIIVFVCLILPCTLDETLPISQLKYDWKVSEMWLNDIAMQFSSISRPFNYRSVDWIAKFHVVISFKTTSSNFFNCIEIVLLFSL